MALQTDGKIVVVGLGIGGVWNIARYKHDGSLDTTFSGNGWTTVTPTTRGGEGSCSVAIQLDGKIVIGGSAADSNPISPLQFAVARLNQDGSLDNTFSGDGVVLTEARTNKNSYLYKILVQQDGKIVAVGRTLSTAYRIQVVRYMPDGSLDSSFGNGGIAEPGFGAGFNEYIVVALLQSDGKILLASDDESRLQFGVGRLLENGNEDTSFSGDGWVTCNFATGTESPASITVRQDGRITVSGRAGTAVNNQFDNSNDDYAVMRLMPDGAFDTSFSGDGKNLIPVESIPGMTQAGTTAGPWHVLRPDGKILLGGWYPKSGMPYTSQACLARLDAAGELDPAFSGDGFARISPSLSDSDSIGGLVAQPDGKVLTIVSGAGMFRIARVISDADSDGDGADDSTEAAIGTNPNDRDSDDDGLEDGPELALCYTNPLDPDTDKDGLLDGVEVNQYHTSPLLSDTDFDGLSDYAEVVTYGTDPSRADSDGDGLNDYDELFVYHTNPNLADTDNDGLNDGAEISHGTNLTVKDTDGDGFTDGYEVLTGKSPTDILDHPALVAEARTAIEFTFPSALGKSYRIEGSLDLDTWTTVESGIAGNGGQIRRFYSTRNAPQRFLRVEEVVP